MFIHFLYVELTPTKVASSFDTFHGTALKSTMAKPTDQPSLVTPPKTYRDYCARSETDTFCGHYSAFLRLYRTKATNYDTTVSPQGVSWKI